MEAAIRLAELDVERAKTALEDPAVAHDAGELHKRQDSIEAARKRLEELFARWEELEGRR